MDKEYEIKNLEPHNVANNRSYVPSEVYDYLNDYFKPHNLELYELLGVDYEW